MLRDSSLRVAGFVPLSTVDRPGQLTATVFTQGCPWRCFYCHNPHLQPYRASDAPGSDRWDWAQVVDFLETRRGLLDGVAFSGGEPVGQPGLAKAIHDVRDAGFEAYLHTGGADPGAFEPLLATLGWVGFDVKAPFREYERVTAVAGSGARARESLRVLVESGVPYEVRTTVHSNALDMAALTRLARELADAGVGDWVLQEFRSQGTREGTPPNTLTLDQLDALREWMPALTVR